MEYAEGLLQGEQDPCLVEEREGVGESGRGWLVEWLVGPSGRNLVNDKLAAWYTNTWTMINPYLGSHFQNPPLGSSFPGPD